MLPRSERLGRNDFSTLFASGRRYHHEFFTVINAKHATFHASVVVPQKVAKKAVVRNRMRRRIYDILRRNSLLRKNGGVYIVLVKKPALAATYEELKAALAALVIS